MMDLTPVDFANYKMILNLQVPINYHFNLIKQVEIKLYILIFLKRLGNYFKT